MRVLVCGSRYFKNEKFLYDLLTLVHRPIGKEPVFTVLIQGGAKGADYYASIYARSNQIPCEEYEADWDKYGKSAGPIRNSKMLSEGKPDLVIAFIDGAGPGTNNMIKLAEKSGVQVMKVSSSDYI